MFFAKPGEIETGVLPTILTRSEANPEFSELW